jgi:hypothetical protein
MADDVGMILEGNIRVQIDILVGDRGISRKTSIRIADVSTEIRTEHLTSVILEHYLQTSLFGDISPIRFSTRGVTHSESGLRLPWGTSILIRHLLLLMLMMMI